ncbi:MAG: response regulator [Chloroflexi bacterium]|nr:response regulator [Chloroflexota bacterium]
MNDLSNAGIETPLAGDILIVDDEPANLRLLLNMLIEQGYKVRSAPSGRLALTGAQAVPPDLILLDIRMPDLSGFEVCKQLKANPRTCDIPIIFISALGQVEDKVRAFTLGGVDYITKPFQIEEVLARVRTHLELHTLQRQLTEEKTYVESARAMLWTVLNNIDALIYVADLETYEILFANVQLEQVFGKVEGCICWQALQDDQTEPCSFCSNHALLDEQRPPDGIHRWQFQNTRNGRWYTVADSVIEWMDGRLVRLSMAADITAYKQTEIQLLAQQRLMVALDERERIGRELHDDLGQAMSYIGVQIQTALAVLEQTQTAQAKIILTQLTQVVQDANDNVLQHMLGIRTPTLSPTDRQTSPSEADVATELPLDFFAVLDQYLHAIHERHGLETQVSRPQDLQNSPFSSKVETQLLRIIQEALTNIRKHASVSTARLLFTLHVDEVQVIVEDDGRGFEMPQLEIRRQPQVAPKYFGLSIMRERAEMVGGSLEVRSAPGEGTRIIVRVPRVLVPLSSEMPDKTVRVMLVDDHPFYLEGLRSMLTMRGLQVVGEANDGLEAIEKAHTLRPDLILMDVQMPHCDGIEATRRIKAELPEITIVMLTMAAQGDTLFKALESGASGYLLKILNGDQFFSLLNKAMRGETVLSPDLATRMLTEFADRDIHSPMADQDIPLEEKASVLTVRQHQILDLVARGLSNKEIAQELSVSENTIKYHVRQILERLQLKSRYELAQYAQNHG